MSESTAASTAAHTTDVELTRRIRGGDDAGESAAAEIVRRHRPAVLAHALPYCRDRKAAEELTDEAFARTLQAVRDGRGPSGAWLPYLVTAVRRTAARWAVTGRDSRLSSGFTSWLAGLPRTDPESAALAAEENSRTLQAFRTLPEPSQAVLWDTFVEAVEPAVRGTDSPSGTDGPPAALARQHLYEAYLRAYALQAPSRVCRHLTAVMDDTVRNGVSHGSEDLDQHVATCESCSRVLEEITAIHTGRRTVLSAALLLWTGNGGSTQPAEGDTAVPAIPPQHTGGVTERPRHRAGSRRPGVARRLVPATRAGVTAAVVGGAAAIAAVITAITPSGAAHDTRPPLARDTAGTATSTPTSTGAPGKGKSPTTRPVPEPAPADFQLVNHKTGLCVGVQDADGADGADGAPAQLQDCVGSSPSQRWESIAAGQDAYQLRNAGTGKCLDGTHGDADAVRVVQSECHDPADGAGQRWKFQPDTDTRTYRLLFDPQAATSDHPSHLLGPEDWAEADHPRRGSFLAQLPNYSNSDSFLFTLYY